MDHKKYKYRILKEQKLVIKYYSGNLSLKELYDFVEYTGNDTDYLPTMSVINDLRDCFIAIDNEGILDFIHKIKENQKVYDQRKSVFLTDTPNQVVFSSMIEFFKNEPLIELNIVSTIERALRCLMISKVDDGLIHRTLHELKLNGKGSL